MMTSIEIHITSMMLYSKTLSSHHQMTTLVEIHNQSCHHLMITCMGIHHLMMNEHYSSDSYLVAI